MKEKLKNKKVVYAIIGIIVLILVTIGITYAYWLVTRKQEGENVISSGCLDISLSNESNDISLTNQFPLSDEEGKELTPYTFTVTNNCNTSVDYQIALETIANSDNKEVISASALKVMLDENTAMTLDKYFEKETTIEGATSSNMLGKGTLESKNSTATHSVRIWIDEDAPISEMNKTFTGKISITVGQGIENTGTLANAILAANGGLSNITSINSEIFSEPGYEVETQCETKNKESVINPICGSASDAKITLYSSYEFDEEGNVIFSNKIADTNFAECKAGTYDCENNYFSGESFYRENSALQIIDSSQIPDEDPVCQIIGVKVKEYVKECSSETIYKTNGTGVYKTVDDIGDSYYFRGEVENNYVKFGKWSNDDTINAGNDMYWRIVRINGDGSIRLIYDGVEKVKNGIEHNATIGNSAYYNWDSNLKFPGYMYDSEDEPFGNKNSSDVKILLESWYADNLENDYGKYIEDTIFCNDRAKSGNVFDNSSRLISNPIPTLKCSQKDDRFTVSNKLGNTALTKPVGMITADEMVFAGLSGVCTDNMCMERSYNNTFYLSMSGEYWTMTPSMYSASDVAGNQVFFVSDTFNGSDKTSLVEGDMLIDGVAASRGIRPVINLRADVEFTGNGSFDTPYEVVMN